MNRNNNNSMADRRNRNAARLDRGWRYFRCRTATAQRRLQKTLMGLLNLSAGTTRKQEPHSPY